MQPCPFSILLSSTSHAAKRASLKDKDREASGGVDLHCCDVAEMLSTVPLPGAGVCFSRSLESIAISL